VLSAYRGDPVSFYTTVGGGRKTKISSCICFAGYVPTAWLLSFCSAR
jgi:hypothetical protein